MDTQEILWHHVTPLFLLPSILRDGGLRCGADLENVGMPRRQSGREFDDMVLESLGNARPSDCVLLFSKRNPPLLQDKLAKTRTGIWKSFPHIELDFRAHLCLKEAGGRVFGSQDNVGRTLKKKKNPSIKPYTSYLALNRDKVQEIMIPASSLPNRILKLSAVRSVRCFSPHDRELVEQIQRYFDKSISVDLELKKRYVAGQAVAPGSDYLEKTRAFFDAIQSGKEDSEARLRRELAQKCFD